MIKVEDMTAEESRALLRRAPLGHLGCARDDQPYVVPMHYAYADEGIYFFTTEGTKTGLIAANAKVCFQVEEIEDASRWQSVMVMGRAVRLTQAGDTEHAMSLISRRNPTLTPALNVTEIGAWHRANNVVIYRLRPEEIYGRKALG